MKKLIFLCLSLFFCGTGSSQVLTSPDGNLILSFRLRENGVPVYNLRYKDKTVTEDSKMGFIIDDAPFSFAENFSVIHIGNTSSDETWMPVWGENSKIRDHHTEMLVSLIQEKTNRKLDIRFRLFNDGLGFRYEFPARQYFRHFIIKEENTEFNLAGDHKAFWLPADYDTNEFPTTTSRISQIAGLIDKVRKEPLAAKAPSPNLAVQTPLMMKTDDNLYINIHEAALVNYPAMFLNISNDKTFSLSSHLAPDKNGNKAYMQTGSVTPWRTLIVSDDARVIS